MTKGNGSAGASLGVLAEITGLLASITPEQFIAPPEGQEDGDHVVAVATDDVKRLYVLRDRLTDKYNELVKSARTLSEGIMKDILVNGPLMTHVELNTPGSPMYEAEAKLKRKLAELQNADTLRRIVEDVFWLEVRRQHPDLEDKSIVGICSDWSLVWTDEKDEEDDTRGISIEIVGSGTLAGILGLRPR